MEGETLLPLKWPNCFQMTESGERFDSSGGLVTSNALALTQPIAGDKPTYQERTEAYSLRLGQELRSR